MILTSQIKSRDAFHAVVTVEMRTFTTSATEELFFLLGIDLVTGDVNISSGMKQGSSKLPELPANDPDEIEQAAAYATLDFLRHLEGANEDE